MSQYSYLIRWSEDDQEYVVTCPAFPGLSGLGETQSDALREAEIALDLMVETYRDQGLALPPSSVLCSYSGQLRVRLPKSLHRQAAEIAQLEDVSLNQLIVCSIQTKVANYLTLRDYGNLVKAEK